MVAFENKSKLAADLKGALGDLSDLKLSRPTELVTAKTFRVDTSALEAKVENKALGVISHPSAARFYNRSGYQDLLERKEILLAEKAYGANPRPGISQETLTQLSTGSRINWNYQTARAADAPIDSDPSISVANKPFQRVNNRLNIRTSESAVVNAAGYSGDDLQTITRFRMVDGKAASAKVAALN